MGLQLLDEGYSLALLPPPPSRLADNELYIYKIILKLFAYPGGQCRHYRGLNKPKTSQSSKVHLLMKKIIMNIT